MNEDRAPNWLFGLTWAALLICLLSHYAHCQTPQLDFIRALENGNYQIKINGAEMICITPEKARQILVDRAELENARKVIANLQEQIGLLEKERDALRNADKAADAQIAAMENQLTVVMSSVIEQRALLDEAMKILRKPKWAAWLESPIAAVVVKFGVPIGNLILTRLR